MPISMQDVRAASGLNPGLVVRLAMSQGTDVAGLLRMIADGEVDFELEAWARFDRPSLIRMRVAATVAERRRRMEAS